MERAFRNVFEVPFLLMVKVSGALIPVKKEKYKQI